MTYNYPFFSFPHFRRYPNYYSMQNSYMSRATMINRPSVPNYQFKNSIRGKNLPSSGNYENYKNYGNYADLNKDNKKEDKHQDKQQYIQHDKQHRNSSRKTPSGFSFLNNFLHQEDRDEKEEFFELFGLKLYNDDLLLIGLIFFLYKEDVKDQYLFFALVLLLLS